MVLSLAHKGIASITGFADPALLEYFGPSPLVADSLMAYDEAGVSQLRMFGRIAFMVHRYK